MILTFDALEPLRGRVAMVDGAFDPLHAGHIEYFSAASRLGLPLLCNVAGDEYVSTKHPPLLAGPDRVVVIDAIRYISFTHLSRFDTETVLEQLRPRYYVKGNDWEARGLPAAQLALCERLGIEIVYLDTVRDSSSRLLERFTLKQNGVS